MRIVIDAGHGPETAGKRTPDGSLREYQFNSAVALLVGALLFDYEGVEVLMVHEDGRDVPLQERTNKANAWGADLYVSVHANANGSGSWDSANGIETYVYTTRPPAAVALALAVQRQLIRRTGLLDRGVKSADFHVLRETKMPAILVECGFMTNKIEAELLKADAFRKSCAAAIVAGIVETYGLKAKPKEESPVENTPKLSQEVAANIIESYLKKAWAECDAERVRAEQEGRTVDAEAWKGLRDWQHHLANELRAASGLPADG
jgi:N-acetylmuramoyl-L-alanine amidase